MCDEVLTRGEEKEHRDNLCAQRMVSCPAPGTEWPCTWSGKAIDLAMHQSKCSGCIVAKIAAYREELAQLEEMYVALESKTGQVGGTRDVQLAPQVLVLVQCVLACCRQRVRHERNQIPPSATPFKPSDGMKLSMHAFFTCSCAHSWGISLGCTRHGTPFQSALPILGSCCCTPVHPWADAQGFLQ